MINKENFQIKYFLTFGDAADSLERRKSIEFLNNSRLTAMKMQKRKFTNFALGMETRFEAPPKDQREYFD